MKSGYTLLVLLTSLQVFADFNSQVTVFAPDNLEPGKIQTISITMLNTGSSTWNPTSYPPNSVRLKRISSQTWLPSEVSLTQNIATGGAFTFRFSVTAPATPGTTSIRYRLQRKFFSWSDFGATALKNMTIQYLPPSQFIAKLYTEALGRAPDQAGWQSWHDYFAQNGYTLANLQAIAQAFFTSAEYNSLGYDNDARLISLYRAALSRDPDAGGFVNFRDLLNNGTPFSDVVSAVFSSQEFAVLAVFSGNSYGWKPWSPDYLPNLNLDRSNSDASCNFTFGGGTGAALQTLLNGATSGQTVCLAQKEGVWVTSALIIPAGVTLKTKFSGSLGRSHYAQFGRLIRSGLGWWDGPVCRGASVCLSSGSSLENIWVDGQEAALGKISSEDVGVFIPEGATNVTVRECKISDTPGWSSLLIFGGTGSVLSNTVTAYPSQHEGVCGANCAPWVDGISNSGNSFLVSGNHVVDATDVGIVLFATTTSFGFSQSSNIQQNIVVNAGNSAYGGIAVDQHPCDDDANGQADPCDNLITETFSNSSITQNILLTGSNSHQDIAIWAGTGPLFGAATHQGVTNSSNDPFLITDNVVSSRCNIGITSDHMDLVIISGNTFPGTTLINTTGLAPLVNILVHDPTVGIDPSSQSGITLDNDPNSNIFNANPLTWPIVHGNE